MADVDLDVRLHGTIATGDLSRGVSRHISRLSVRDVVGIADDTCSLSLTLPASEPATFDSISVSIDGRSFGAYSISSLDVDPIAGTTQINAKKVWDGGAAVDAVLANLEARVQAIADVHPVYYGWDTLLRTDGDGLAAFVREIVDGASENIEYGSLLSTLEDVALTIIVLDDEPHLVPVGASVGEALHLNRNSGQCSWSVPDMANPPGRGASRRMISKIEGSDPLIVGLREPRLSLDREHSSRNRAFIGILARRRVLAHNSMTASFTIPGRSDVSARMPVITESGLLARDSWIVESVRHQISADGGYSTQMSLLLGGI